MEKIIIESSNIELDHSDKILFITDSGEFRISFHRDEIFIKEVSGGGLSIRPTSTNGILINYV